MSFRSQFLAGWLLLAPAFAGTNNTILVSAPRLDDLDLMDVAVAADVTLVDRETIERSGAASTPELLEKEAGVRMRGTSGNGDDGEISMRGFGEGSGLRVLVLVDGHKANRPDMGGIEWRDIPVSNIERIEVIRGGQNVLYGNHALSGVVKITTKRGDDAGLQLKGSVGSYGYRSGAASYGESVGDVDLGVGVSSYWHDGYRSNSTSHATTFSASAGWFMNDTDVLTLRASASDGYVQFPGPLLYDQMKQDPTQSNSLGDEFSEDRSGLATLLYETERDWGAARVNTGLNLHDRDTTLGGRYHHDDLIGISFAPRLRFGSRNDFFMGGIDLLYDGEDVDHYLDADRDIVKAWAELDRITASPYLFAQRTFHDKKTILNGGMRYEYAGTDNQYLEYVENQLSPTIDTNRGPIPNPDYKNPPDIDPDKSYEGRVEKDGWAAELSVSRKISEQGEIFAGYDRVYRYPTLDETASYQGYPLSDPLNEDLDPEHGNNYEVGARFDNREWTVSLTGFYMALDNEIAFDDVLKLNTNIGATRRLGVEPEIAWNREWYGAATRWTFVDARMAHGENDGNRVPLVPWASGTTSAWVEPVPEFRLTASHTYVAEQYQGGDEENDDQKTDPYGLFDLRANIAMSDHVSLVISINNLFDEIYATSAYSGGFYPGSGRNFRFGMTMVY